MLCEVREESPRRLARMAFTLVVVPARFRLVLLTGKMSWYRQDFLCVLQVARDELASVRRTAIQVVQITIVGAAVQSARDLRFRTSRHDALLRR